MEPNSMTDNAKDIDLGANTQPDHMEGVFNNPSEIQPQPQPQAQPQNIVMDSAASEEERLASEMAMKMAKTYMELQKQQEMVERAERIAKDPMLAAEDILLSSEIPEDHKDASINAIREMLVENPHMDVATARGIAKTIARKAAEEYKAQEEYNTRASDQKFGGLQRKYGELGWEIQNKFIANSVANGISETMAKNLLAQMNHKEYLDTIDHFYKTKFLAMGPTVDSNEVARQQKIEEGARKLRESLDKSGLPVPRRIELKH